MFISEQYGLDFNEGFLDGLEAYDNYWMNIVMYWDSDTTFAYCGL